MPPSYERIRNQHILYDPALLKDVSPSFFDPERWRRSGSVNKEARGRGTALFISDGSHDFVLRHYRRGGLIAKVITDHYLWQGLARTRAWQEWHLLDWMFRQGLPVPQPVAARVVKDRWAYRADLLTLELPHCSSLADHITMKTLSEKILRNTGQCIRRFHAAGIFHADLNTFNILVNEKGMIYLIDFDRGCRRREGGRWQSANLSRLHRSLTKQENKAGSSAFPEKKWTVLLNAYRKG